jgi:hypothetical protein
MDFEEAVEAGMIEMSNDEIRMSEEIRNPKSENATGSRSLFG